MIAALMIGVLGIVWMIQQQKPSTTTVPVSAIPPELMALVTQSQSEPSPIPTSVHPREAEASLDKTPLLELRKGMDAYVATYPREAAQYALRKIEAIGATEDLRERNRALVYSSAIAYALAHTDPSALAEFITQLPKDVKPFASGAATARYITDNDMEAAKASITPESAQWTVMQVAEALAKQNPQAAADWTQQFRGTPNYELAVMEVIRAFAQSGDVKLAQDWVKTMPEGSNRETMERELLRAVKRPAGEN